MPDSVPSAAALRGNSPLGLLRDALAAAAGQRRALDWQAPAPEVLAPLLPDFEVLRLAGRGGMGAVYECRQRSLDRRVALKLLPIEVSGDDTFAERFRAEGRALARLQHPNIVTLYEAGRTSAGHLWFTMELVEGEDLATLLARQRLPQKQALDLIEAVATALVFAHEHGVIHRDLKPANILLGSDGRPRVADFGLARLGSGLHAAPALTTDSVPEGGPRSIFTAVSPAYTPPERNSAREADAPRADLYSLAVLACELLSGRTPPDAHTGPSQLAPGVDARLDAPILRALRPNPADRQASVAEFLAQLRFVRDEVDNEAQHLSRRARVRRIAALLIFLAAVAVAGLFVAHRQSERARRSEAAGREAAALTARHAAALDYDRANALLAKDPTQTSLAAAHLARALRADPSHRLAGVRLASLLIANAQFPPRVIAAPADVKVHTADFTPDGRSVALACSDGRVRFHNVVSGALEKEFSAGTNPVYLLQFSRDGQRAFTAGRDAGLPEDSGDANPGRGLVWDLTRDPPAPVGPPLRFDDQWALLADFSPDGTRVFPTGVGNSARLYDVATGQPLPVTFTHERRLWRADFSPDGKRVLTSSDDGTARVWDAATGAELFRLPHPRTAYQSSFSRDGTRILTGGGDQALRVWHAATGQLVGPPIRPATMLHICHFADDADGERLVVTTINRELRLWDAASGQPLTEPFRAPMTIRFGRLGPDGATLLGVTRADRVFLYDAGPAPGPAPVWFADFAEARLGVRLDEAGQLATNAISKLLPASTVTNDGTSYSRLAQRLATAAGP